MEQAEERPKLGLLLGSFLPLFQKRGKGVLSCSLTRLRQGVSKNLGSHNLLRTGGLCDACFRRRFIVKRCVFLSQSIDSIPAVP